MSKEELQELVHGFRSTLEALQSSGTYGVSGLPSERILGELPEAEAGTEEAGRSLAQVREELGDCQRCSLSQERNQIVFGCGDERAELMFVGEAPGAEEDKRGEPFVGAAGQLLDKMIVAMGWTRESVYITNVLKCRPPNNRDPKTEEVAACENFLAQQIQVIQPAVIVTLGKPAAHLLLKTSASMASLRGIWQDYSGIPVMPTYHPAYLLRDPSKKRDVWADLQQVMKRFE
jgi:DNA polymerase